VKKYISLSKLSRGLYYRNKWAVQICKRDKALTVQDSSTQIFKQYRSHLKILGDRRVTWGKFHTVGAKMLGSTM